MRNLDKYEGHAVIHSFDFNAAYHNYYFESLTDTAKSGARIVKVTYSITTYRMYGGDQHPSLFSTGEDCATSGFGGTKIFFTSFYTSTRETNNYISGILSDFTPQELKSLFARPGVTYLHSEVGTTSPTEMAPRLLLLKSKSIDLDTLDDTQ